MIGAQYYAGALCSQKVPELLRRQACSFGDTAHGDGINGIVPGNGQPGLPVSQDNMSALACDVKTELFKNAHGVLLADAWNLGHSALNGDEFRRDFLMFLSGLTPDVFLRDLKP